jgi:metal-responsive CopG/Arc/MetJ family transcriptional regulator
MKTFVTIPGDLFVAAEKAARQLGVSRSELFTSALRWFLGRQEEEVTARLNDVYAVEPAALDPVLAQMQFTSLRRDSW